MKNKQLLPIQRLIGKIDNDFNIDHSDWIPRIAAWVIDALGQTKCLPKVHTSKTFTVKDRVAIGTMLENVQITRVICSNGFTVHPCKVDVDSFHNLPNHHHCHHGHHGTHQFIGVTTNDRHYEHDTQVAHVIGHGENHNYIHHNNYIELNFDTDYIIVEGYYLDTYNSDEFGCEIPKIYDNALLLEAVEMYCLYKILSRGYKHPVFNLTGPEPVNPYLQWLRLKTQAKASVINQLQEENKGKGNDNWNNFFYDSTFIQRH